MRSSDEDRAGPAWLGTAKVVRLRGLRRTDTAREVPQMRNVTIDLQTPIDGLRLIRSDLEAYFWDYPADGEARRVERYQISYWMRQISSRASALEGILMDKGARRLAVSEATPAERETLQAAVTVLDQSIPEDESFRDAARRVADILEAADRIGLRAAGGVPWPTPAGGDAQ